MSPVTRPLFHDANSKRGGVLMHAKVGSSLPLRDPLTAVQVLIALFEPRGQKLGMQAMSSSRNGKRKAADPDSTVGGWVYVGSHNFSSAAWVRECGSALRASAHDLCQGHGKRKEKSSQSECEEL